MTRTHTCLLVATGSALHLLVDGLCICSLYLVARHFTAAHLAGIFVLYNVLAFLTQPLTGMLADAVRNRHRLLAASVVLLVTAVGLTMAVAQLEYRQPPMVLLGLLAALLGMGNSLFHVWGGKLTAVKTGNDRRALGIFVATGALGLALGGVFCSWPLLVAFMLAICLLAMLYLHIDLKTASPSKQPTAQSPHLPTTMLWAALLILMAIVMGRSFVGEHFAEGLERTQLLILVLALTAMAGKMAGGWMARYMGDLTALAVLLVAAMVCFLLKDTSMAVLLAGLFLINCTMPVTLALANHVLPGREGLAFGLLAAALMPGYLLALA